MDSDLNLDINYCILKFFFMRWEIILSMYLTTKLLYDNRLVYNCKTHKLNVQILYLRAGTHRYANTNARYLSSMCSYDEETHLHDILSCVQWYKQWLLASMLDSVLWKHGDMSDGCLLNRAEIAEFVVLPWSQKVTNVISADFIQESQYTALSPTSWFNSVQFNFAQFPFNIRCSRSHQVL